MGYVLFALVWAINFGISVWNAYAVGKVWVEARHAGGWRRFMCWMGAVMSASGFSWCYLSFLALSAHVGLRRPLPADDAMTPEKRLFKYSILYLFVLFGMLVVDHLATTAGA